MEKIELIVIIGEIEGHQAAGGQSKATKYEELLPKLAQIERDRDVDGVLVLLNTEGGDVEAGLAIAEMVSSLSKPTVSLVLGGSHSIGVPIAVSTDYSFSTLYTYQFQLDPTILFQNYTLFFSYILHSIPQQNYINSIFILLRNIRNYNVYYLFYIFILLLSSIPERYYDVIYNSFYTLKEGESPSCCFSYQLHINTFYILFSMSKGIFYFLF